MLKRSLAPAGMRLAVPGGSIISRMHSALEPTVSRLIPVVSVMPWSSLTASGRTTMQLARNLFLSPDRSFHRKVQETMLAIQIERHFTKPQIFTLYANQIFLGHGVYGFEAASEFYFSKPAKQLTLDEATLLAGLPKSASGWIPPPMR